MFQNNQPSNVPLNQEDEVTLIDILLFLSRSWKIIVIFGVFGLSAAIIYLLIAPKQYQGLAQIQMGQIIAGAKIMSINGINIEEPNVLIIRMSLPTTFTSATIAACGFDGKRNAASMLAKSLELRRPNGAPNLVELKVMASNSEGALQCAQAIFELVRTSQDKIARPFIEEAKIKLAEDLTRLAKAKELIFKADKSGAVINTAYLSIRDEVRYLLDEVTALQNIIASSETRSTRLVAPIYVSDYPISPNVQVLLAAGLLGGLFLGLLIAFGLHSSLKSNRNLTASLNRNS